MNFFLSKRITIFFFLFEIRHAIQPKCAAFMQPIKPTSIQGLAVTEKPVSEGVMGIRAWWASTQLHLKEQRQAQEKWKKIKDRTQRITVGKNKKKSLLRVKNVDELRFVSGFRGIHRCDVRGNCFEKLAKNPKLPEHPVIEVLRRRREEGYKPGSFTDNLKVGLCIEGGGMRGCVTAGMAACISDMKLVDCFDAVYGSSAGSLIGAYVIGQQEGMPRYGVSLYYDLLTGKSRHFIDTRYFLRTLGLGVLYNPGGWKDIIKDRLGKPVLKLDYLLQDVVQKIRPLDFKKFWDKQQSQPLHVIASNVKTRSSISMNSASGHWNSLETLCQCMRASMNLPGLAGPPISIPTVSNGDPLVDSQMFEPIPYRTALKDGCTHLLVLRSRPDGVNVCGKKSGLERSIMHRFFKRKNKFPEMFSHMKRLGHKVIYSEDVLNLNDAASNWEIMYKDSKQPKILPIAPQIGVEEIGRLERSRSVILEGVQSGFAHAHKILKAVDYPAELQGYHVNMPDLSDGWDAARKIFPDSILLNEYDPVVGIPSDALLQQ